MAVGAGLDWSSLLLWLGLPLGALWLLKHTRPVQHLVKLVRRG